MKQFSLVIVLLIILLVASDAAPRSHKKASKERFFISPDRTVLEPISYDSTLPPEGAEVTFRLKLDGRGNIHAIELDSCTSSDTSFVVTARDAIKNVHIDPLELRFLPKSQWFCHTVVVRPRWADTPQDSSDRPDDTAFIPVDQQPEMVYKEKPEYPRSAMASGTGGTVWVKVLVARTGLVTQAKVARSSGSPAFDTSVVHAAYYNRFKPALQDGKPVAIWVTYKVDFKVGH